MEIKEIFYSYQGEGYNFGKPVIFVRFAGCNLSCSFCDEALTRKNNKINSKYQISSKDALSQIVDLMEDNNCHALIFTGGEPSLYYEDVKLIIDHLNSIYVDMWYGCESNGTGTCDFYDLMNFTCISPKYKQTTLDHFILATNKLPGVSELRIVVDQYNEDFRDWVVQMLISCKEKVTYLYLSPVTTFNGKDMLDWTDTNWSFNIKDTMKLYNELKDDFDLRISLQTHKLIGVR